MYIYKYMYIYTISFCLSYLFFSLSLCLSFSILAQFSEIRFPVSFYSIFTVFITYKYIFICIYKYVHIIHTSAVC